MESRDILVICVIVLVLGVVQTYAQKEPAQVTILNMVRIEARYGKNWLRLKNNSLQPHGTNIRQSCKGSYELYRDGYLDKKYTWSTSKNGRWDPQLAICKEKRCDIPAIANGTLTLADGSTARGKVEHRVVVTTECDSKFEIDPSSKANNRCWYGQLQLKNCVEKHCGPPDAVNNAKLEGDLDRTTWQHGDNVTYMCSQQGMITYSINNRRTCNYGKWTEAKFECEWKTCSHIDHPSHGRRLTYNNEPTGITEFECDEGYTMRGSRKLLCMVGGQWRPENPPTCHPVMCPEPEEIAHGSKFQEAPDGIFNDFGSVVSYMCDKDYEPEGQMRRRCQANGQWEGKNPACILSPGCPKINLENGKVEYSGQPITKNTYVTIECDKYADLDPPDGLVYLVCLADKTWSGAVPFCRRQARVVGLSKDLIVWSKDWAKIPGGTRVKHGTKINLSCKSGYELYREKYLNEDYTESTSTNGYWEPRLATCKKKRCQVPNIADGTLKLRDGSTARGKVEHGIRVTTVCDDAFELDPKHKYATSRCRIGKLQPKTCSPKRCDVPEKRDNTVYISSGSTLQGGKIHHGTLLWVACTNKDEYELVFEKRDGTMSYMNTFKTECQYGKYKSPDTPHCEERRCDVSQLEGVKTVMKGYITSGDRISVECARGYRFHGNAKQQSPITVTCNKGQLDGFVPCEPEPCQVPQIENTDFSYKEIQHGTKIPMSCNRGYEFRDGFERVNLDCKFGVLDSDSDIPLDTLECSEKKCSVTKIGKMSGMVVSDADRNTLYADTKVDSGALVYTECSKGYVSLTDDARTLACNLGEWNGTFDCLERGCAIPVIQNAEEIGDYYPDYDGGIRHGEQIDIICKKGYEIFHESERTTVTCEFGEWIDLPSGCFAKKCSVKQLGDMSVMDVSDTDGNILHGDSMVDSGDVVYPECIKGYMSLENNTITPACNLGEWSGPFACQERRCSTPTIENAKLYRWPTMSELFPDDTDTFVNGQTIRVTCNERFVIADSESRDYLKELTCVDGEWDSEVSCKPKPCLLTTTEGTSYSVHRESGRVEAVKKDTTIDHGDKISVRCQYKFKLVQDGKDVKIRKETKEKKEPHLSCHFGTLKGGFACEKKICHVHEVTNGEIQLGGKSLNSLFIEEGDLIEVKCNRGFEIVFGSSRVLSQFRTRCFNESLRKSLPTCRRKDGMKDIGCRYPPTDKYVFLFENYTKVENAAYASHGTNVYAVCTSRDQETGSETSHGTTCKDGSWVPDLPTCDPNEGDQATEAGRDKHDKSCILPEDNRYKFDDGNRTSGEKVEHRSRTKIECVDEKSFSYLNYYYYNDDSYYSEKEDIYIMCQDGDFINFNESLLNCNEVLTNECANFTNGKVDQADDFDGFVVTCDEGYNLNVSKRQNKFRCDKGALIIKNYNITASCLPDGCLLPDPLRIRVEKLNKDKSRTGTDLSGGMTVEHEQHVLLNCMAEGYEPKLRTFQCETGQWVSADADWIDVDAKPDNDRGNETIGLFPECRKAICDPPCENGGSCIRDNKCKCPVETKGEHCDKFKCPECESNGGSCPVSTACVCPVNKEGNLCQNFKCDDKCKSNGGTCPFSTTCVCPDNKEGEFCQNFKCNEKCTRNGGSCPYSNKCHCPANKYGMYCQHFGCLGSDAKIPSVQQNKLYRQEEAARHLKCGQGQRLVGNDTSLVCRAGIWRGDVACEKIMKNTYRIRVKTGNEGTNGDVYLKLYGENGESEEVELTDDMDNKLDKFKREDTDEFSVHLTDVGKIRSISVRHDAYPLTYWSLATVAIFDHARKQYYPFFWNGRVYDNEKRKRQVSIYPNRYDPLCRNEKKTCSTYPKSICWQRWMKQHCAKFCGYCKIGKLCGDKFTGAELMDVPAMQSHTTARDDIGCILKCAEIEKEACYAAVFRPRTKDCFWLNTDNFYSTADATQGVRFYELVYTRLWC